MKLVRESAVVRTCVTLPAFAFFLCCCLLLSPPPVAASRSMTLHAITPLRRQRRRPAAPAPPGERSTIDIVPQYMMPLVLRLLDSPRIIEKGRVPARRLGKGVIWWCLTHLFCDMDHMTGGGLERYGARPGDGPEDDRLEGLFRSVRRTKINLPELTG